MRRYWLGTTLLLITSMLITACNQEMRNGTITPACIGQCAENYATMNSALQTFKAITPIATHTASPAIVNCDSSVDYCIFDGSFVLQRPIIPPNNDYVDQTYAYGSTQGGNRAPHHGVEFYNASGTPVQAVADGVVLFAGDDRTIQFGPYKDFYGNLVILEHNLPNLNYEYLYTLYAHLSRVDVTTGQRIHVGEQIGLVGATGSAIGSHLHFEVRLDAQDYFSTLNPEIWLMPNRDTNGHLTGLLALRFVDSDGQFIHANPNVQYFPSPNNTYTAAYQPEVYADETINPKNDRQENVVLGNLSAGNYRITFYWAGVIQERWIEIQAGKITLAVFIIK